MNKEKIEKEKNQEELYCMIAPSQENMIDSEEKATVCSNQS